MMMIKILVKMMFDVNDDDDANSINEDDVKKTINTSSFLCDCKIKMKALWSGQNIIFYCPAWAHSYINFYTLCKR